jgi:hypothetical protein
MRLSSPAEDLFGLLKRYSGDKLTRPEDLALLLEAASQHKALDTLEELSFHAKFVANASGALQRIGTTDANAARLSAELQTEIATVTRLIRLLLAHSPLFIQERFAASYFAVTPEAMQNFFSLCYDLSWYKNWLIDHPDGTQTAALPAARTSGIALWHGALFAIILGVIFWLGSFTVRAFVANDLLIPGTMQFNDHTPPAVERHLYRVLAGSAILMVGGYILVLLASIVFLRSSPLRLREHGWLLMSALLFYLFVPVEVYAMSLDVRMILLEFFSDADVTAFREVFLARVGALAGAPFVAALCYFTVIALSVFQPFRRNTPPAS